MENNPANQPDGAVPSQTESAIVIKIPNVPRRYADRVAWLKGRPRAGLGMFALTSKRVGGVPDLNNETNGNRLEEAEQFLNFLEHDSSFQMTPKLRQDASIDATFDVILRKPDFHFPEAFKDRAQRIYDSWVNADWGAGAEEDEESGDDESLSGSTGRPATTATTAQVTNAGAEIRYPPANHPIWGIRGIMNGTARVARQTGKDSMVLDKRYPKRPCKVYGPNGLEPGDWFPYQLVALFQGAHGLRQAGIHGDHQHGAYSIVISSKYHHIDQDEGDTIYYSGAGSDENKDPRRVAAGKHDATLVASVTSQNPVRVLRAANKANHLAPSVGLRYDGLYRVVRQEDPRTNDKGGLYRRFVLERLSDQPDLASVVAAVPSPKLRRDFEKIAEGFQSLARGCHKASGCAGALGEFVVLQVGVDVGLLGFRIYHLYNWAFVYSVESVD